MPDHAPTPPAAQAATGWLTQGGGIRPATWILGIVLALAMCLAVPALHHWFRLSDPSSAQMNEHQSITGAGFLPILPLCGLLVAVAVWNPLLARLRPAWALRRSELLLLVALGYGTAGVVEGGLARPWAKTLFFEAGIGKNEISKYKEVLDQAPYAYSLPHAGSISDAQALLTQLESELAKTEGITPALADSIQNGLAKLRLRRDLLPDEGALAVLAQIKAGTADSAGLSHLRQETGRAQGCLRAEKSLLTGLQDGGGSLSSLFSAGEHGPSPASRLYRPLVWTGALSLLGLVFVIGLGAFTARQWTHHERLQHPLVQVPDALAGGIIRNPHFLIAAGVVLLLWLYQCAASYGWHSLPKLPIGDQAPVHMKTLWEAVKLDVPAGTKWVYETHWSAIKVYPFLIGVAFLLAADIGFSIWGGFWFGCLICGYITYLGIPADFFNHARKGGGSGGAVLAMALVILWLGRYHYARLLAAAFGRRAEEDQVGVLGARMLLGSGLLILLLTWSLAGGGWQGLWAGLLSLALTGSLALVVARVVAESGLACFEASTSLPELVAGSGLPWALPLKAAVLANTLGAILCGSCRQHVGGYTVQSQVLAERGGTGTTAFVKTMTGMLVLGALIALLTHLAGMWLGARGMGAVGGAYGIGGDTMIAAMRDQRSAVLLGLSETQLAIALGFVLIFAVVGLRRIWMACPLHPLGLVVAASWPIHLVWGSLLLGWLAKVLVLRFGGPGIYVRLKPVAYGVIMGDVVAYALYLFSQYLSRWFGAQLNSMQMWP